MLSRRDAPPSRAERALIVQERLETLASEGYVVIEGVLKPPQLEELRAALAPYLSDGPEGRNDFEGEATKRVYSLVGRGAPFEQTALEPAVLELADALLHENYLLTASQAISIGPGESPQPVHYDDAFYRIPRPRPAISLSTIWAVDDFTARNGGTEIVPGSHRWSDEQVAGVFLTDDHDGSEPHFEEMLRPVEMPAGSCVVFLGTLLHRGGRNQSNAPRRAFSHQYCEPWARQQENYFFSIPRERVAAMAPRLQAMLGYSIHPPFMGQIAARHPIKALHPEYRNSLELDDEEIASR